MPFFLMFALGALAFSLLLSLVLFARHSQPKKSDYERWMHEVRKVNVAKKRWSPSTI